MAIDSSQNFGDLSYDTPTLRVMLDSEIKLNGDKVIIRLMTEELARRDNATDLAGKKVNL